MHLCRFHADSKNFKERFFDSKYLELILLFSVTPFSVIAEEVPQKYQMGLIGLQ